MFKYIFYVLVLGIFNIFSMEASRKMAKDGIKRKIEKKYDIEFLRKYIKGNIFFFVSRSENEAKSILDKIFSEDSGIKNIINIRKSININKNSKLFNKIFNFENNQNKQFIFLFQFSQTEKIDLKKLKIFSYNSIGKELNQEDLGI